MKAKYFTNDKNGWKETGLRPSAKVLAQLEAEAEGCKAEAKKHEPGMGWHCIPGIPSFVLNRDLWYSPGESYWWVSWPSSEGAILAETANFCKARGFLLDVLLLRAYPDERFYAPEVEDWDALADRDVVPDLQAVLDDLEDINYHSLYSVLLEAVESSEG